jgi:hypothetical protein
MRKRLVAVLSCIVVAVAVVAYVTSRNSFSPTPPRIGIFYYLWYGAPNSDNWSNPKFVDYPFLGNYSSSDPSVIRQQLIWIEDLGIDFVVISWWGYYNAYEQFIDNSARQVFQIAECNKINLKFAIMVEPFNKTGSSYDYSGIYDCIYYEFVVPYSSLYYNNNGKPLICFFNNEDLTPNGTFPHDERFNVTIVGQENYAQWTYNDLDTNDTNEINVTLHTNEVSVTPRYDNSHLNESSCIECDPNLTEGVYDQEWRNVIQLWKDGKINTIMITSWNEYVERTEIEPHFDATAFNTDPYFLYNKTQYYINQIAPTPMLPSN